MTSTTPTLPLVTNSVNAYHLNIGVGDCTIFDEIDMTKNELKSLVLIDGGGDNASSTSAVYIKDWLNVDGPLLYRFNNPRITHGQLLQFTSIVITHWHEDHCVGILHLIHDDIIRSRIEGVKQNEIQVSFMKYESDGSKRMPQTTLYVPYMAKQGSAKAPPFQFQLNVVSVDEAYIDYNAGTPSDPFIVPKICKVCWGKGTLGVNLFGGDKPAYSADGYGGPVKLAQKFWESKAKEARGNPCLFIVAANQETFDRSSSASVSSSSLSSPSIMQAGAAGSVSHKPGSYPTPVEGVIDRKLYQKDETNLASIFTILVYPPSQNYKEGSVSHYLAGDALWTTEGTVKKWIGGEVKVMKLSHHGSAYSSPMELFDTYKPKTIIISAGDRHHHPSWQVLFWLYVWSFAKPPRARFVWPTCFPYWMYCSVNGTTVQFDVVDLKTPPQTEEAKKFQEVFKAMWQAGEVGGNCWLDEFNQLKPKPGEILLEQQRKFIVDCMIKGWERLSWLKSTAGPASGVYSGSGNEICLTKDDEVSFVRVYSDMTSTNIPDGYSSTYLRKDLVEMEKKLRIEYPAKIERGCGNFIFKRWNVTRARSDLDIPVASMGAMAYQAAVERSGKADDEMKELAFRSQHADDSRSIVQGFVDGGSDDDGDGQIQLQAIGNGFYICSTAISIPQGTSPDKYHQPAKGTELNAFLILLHTGLLSLAAKPDSDGKVPLNADLTNGDELLQWLVNSLGASSVDAYIKASDFAGFGIAFSSPKPMYFATSEIPAEILRFCVSAAPNPFGFIRGLDMLLLGLDRTSVLPTATWTLTDVLGFLGMSPEKMNGLAGLVGLTLDTRSSDARNAIWLRPGRDYFTAIRLQFIIDNADKKVLQDFVAAAFDSRMTVSDVRVVAKKEVRYWGGPEKFYQIESCPTLIVTASVSSPQLGSSLTGHFISEAGLTTLILEPSNGSFGDILDWLFLLVDAPFKGRDILGWLPKGSHEPLVRQMQIVSRQSSLEMFWITIEMGADFGKSPDTNVVFFLRYTWRRHGTTHTFRGSLWCPLTIQDDMVPRVKPGIMPDYEPFSALMPSTTNLQKDIRLSDLVPGTFFKDPPSELDLTVSSLAIEVSSGAVTFTGGMIAKPANPNDPEPVGFRLEAVNLYVSHVPAANTWSVAFNITIAIRGTDPKDYSTMNGSIQYMSETSTWQLQGSIQDLKMSTLVAFFPGTDSPAVMAIMDHIEVEGLEVQYAYEGGTSKEFHIYGAFLFDVVELQMDFHRVVGDGWKLSAQLTAAPREDTSVVKMLKGLLKDSSILDHIPSLLDIPLRSAESVQAGNSLKLSVEKHSVLNKAKKDVDYIVFRLTLVLSDFQLSLVQIKQSSASNDGGVPPPTKRLIQVSVRDMGFRQAQHIPIIGSIQPPFDELDFVWVHDQTGLGLNRNDVDLLDKLTDFPRVKATDTISLNKSADTDILLAAGCHFIVVSDSKATPVLDYVFNRPKTDTPSQPSMALVREATDPTPADGETSMGELNMSQGPLSIKSIGLRYENSTLHVLLDADVELGVFEFSLSGFQLRFSFSAGVNLRNLSGTIPSVDVSGMAVAVNEPPMRVAGLFLNKGSADVVKFVGGVVLTVEPYSFVAVGPYADHATFKSIFLFAELDGPLIELEFAEINGICCGVGYNSALRLPTIADVERFPLVNRSFAPSPADPMDLLAKFTADGIWIKDQDGPLWVAAGLKVKAFQCIDVDAVVTLEFNPSFSLAIVALGRAMMPDEPGTTKDEAFLYVEFGLLALVDVVRGTMMIEGTLAPNSFVLNPFCHLTGGFALGYWFAGSGHEGDWVFSVGGYHPAYKPPAHYPRPDRLSISWDVGSGLMITGTSYFAITPKVCMGGGSLSAVLSAGPLRAYFNAYADFLINYSPFHFTGEVGVSVGVSFSVDLWIVTIHISVDVGARLVLWGPPFGGSVYVDFWVFGFTVGFGNAGVNRDPLSLLAFYQLLYQSDPEARLKEATATGMRGIGSTTTTTPQRNEHVLSVVSGRYSGNQTDVHSPEGAVWVVRRAGFKFSVQGRFAISEMKCNDDAAAPSTATSKVYAKPMHLTDGTDGAHPDLSITSMVTVAITQHETGTKPKFSYMQILKQVPSALWTAWDEKTDPSKASDSSSPLLDDEGKTVTLMMGMMFNSPLAVIAGDLIKDFNALEAMSRDIFPAGKGPCIPSISVAAAETWLPVAKSPGGNADRDWKDVSKAWLQPKTPNDVVAMAVSAWAAAFGYGELNTAAPKEEGSLRGIEIGFLGAPFLSM